MSFPLNRGEITYTIFFYYTYLIFVLIKLVDFTGKYVTKNFFFFLYTVSGDVYNLIYLYNPHGLLGKQPGMPSVKRKGCEVIREHFPVPLKENI